jgi:hypothetical protein
LSDGPHDFRTARTTDEAHGRLEQRTLTISSELKEYLDWPYCEQVFKLERHVVRIKDSKVMDEVIYGLTSLTADEAGPERVLGSVRGQWGIRNGLHYLSPGCDPARRLVLCADRLCAADADADQ